MPRLGRLPLAPATFARGLMFVALVSFHGPASAREPSGRGKRRVDPATARARQLYQQIRWEQGPVTADLGSVAELRVALGFAFTGKDGAKLYLELGQNPVPENLL